ncbi:hypothetical protein C2845_PM03G22100 [Panicum miliaceum]|uniref:F-box protein n=1 Tax=Panicum miliaceum TaxID=4540 RepID=A0A3L6TAW3_PANMI|nr:hypothetical protein C2845_PM03G22100 [Panicum miliaceum]
MLPRTLGGFFYGSGGRTASRTSTRQRQEHVNFINLMWTSAAPFADPPFPFLEDLPGIENVRLLGKKNGLLLFDHFSTSLDLGFVVCNPATKQWVAVPGNCPSEYSDCTPV